MITRPADRSPDSMIDPDTQLRRPHQEAMPRMPATTDELAVPARKSRVWRWLAIIALVAAAWYFAPRWLPWIAPGLTKGSTAPGKGAQRPIPVRTAVAERRDMPLYLNGLGTVTPFKTVTLRSRVDGELVNVAFTEGQMVKEGDLLAEVDPRPFEAQLHQAEGQLARDEATLKLARLTLTRVEELFRAKSIAPQQYDEQIAQVEQMEGTVETDHALVANARLQLSYCRIVSPISGRIGLRLVDQGNIVHASDVAGMAVITQLQPIALVFPVSQDEIPRVQKRTQQEPNLPVDAFDRDFKMKLASGRLYAIDNQVDATTGTVRLKAVFENDDGMLFPNQFVNARLLVDTNRNAMVVPSAAVQRGPSFNFVYVVQADDTVELRTVVPGETEGADTAIETGLQPGEIVVTDGIEKLQNHSKITTRDRENEAGSAGKKVRGPAANGEQPAKNEPRTEGGTKGAR